MKTKIILFSIFVCLIFFSNYSYCQFSNAKVLIDNNPLSNKVLFDDFDNDNDVDVVYAASSNNRIVVYKNDGNGSFLTKDTILTCEKAISNVEVADLNNDLYKDLIVMVDSIYLIYQNNNNLNFNLVYSFIDKNHNLATPHCQVIDLNGDNLKDIILSDNKGAVYINQGNFNFNLTFWSNYGWFYKANDLNGDSFPDLVTMGSNTICVHYNNGNGTFGSRVDFAYNIQYYNSEFRDFEFGDFNQDGHTDIVGSYSITQIPLHNKLILFQNDGSGQFSTTAQIYSLATSNYGYFEQLKVIDLNNDNKEDILIKNFGSTKVLFNLGSNNFQISANTYQGNLSYSFLSLSDINLDNKVEIVVTQEGGDESTENFEEINLYVFDNDSFNLVSSIDLFNKLYTNGTPFKLVDLNNDGIEDFYGPNNSYLLNSNDSVTVAYRSMNNNLSGGYLYDLNHDGFVDCLINPYFSNTEFQLKYFSGQSDGNLVQNSNITNVGYVINNNYNYSHCFQLDDFEGDGDLDIIFPTKINNKVILNNGNGTFVNYSQDIFENYNNVSAIGSIFKVKINNNFQNQIYSAFSNYDDNLLYLKIIGKSNLVELNPNLIKISSIEILDIDNDNLQDILICSTDGIIKWYKNNGNGSVSEMNIISSIYWNDVSNDPYFSYIFKDFDFDGDIDIIYSISSFYNGRIGWLENYSYGNFSSDKHIFSKNISHGFGALTNVMINKKNDVLFVVNFNSLSPLSRGKSLIYKIENLNNSQNINIKGYVFNDKNENKICDSSEYKIQNTKVILQPIGNADFTNNMGEFQFQQSSGVYQISPSLDSNWRISTDSISYNVLIDSSSNYSLLNFGITSDYSINSTEVQLVGGYPKCDLNVNYWINIKNNGTKLNSGIIRLSLDSNIQFVSSFLSYDSISSNSIYWKFDSLNPFETKQIQLVVKMPSYLLMSDKLTSTVTTYIKDSNNIFIENDKDTLNQILTCAYDPNDKIVEPIGQGEEGYIPLSQKYFEYTIRFQNTGNDTATNIRVTDQLSSLLDISTFEFLSSSHIVHISFSNNKLIFDFDGINLPDSSRNFLLSQGYINFKIRAKDSLNVGDEILNFAAIIFDQNPAIITKTVKNTYYACDSLINLNQFNLFGCEGEEIEIMNNSEFATKNIWKLNNDIIFNGATYHYQSSQEIDSIQLIASNDLCFFDTLLIHHNLLVPDVEIMEGNIDTICNGDTLVLSSSDSLNNSWYFNNQLISLNQFHPITDSGVYILKRNNGICYNTDTISVYYKNLLNTNFLEVYSICPGDSITLIAPYSDFNSWFYMGNELISNENFITLSSYGVYVYETFQNSCFLKDTFYLSLYDSPYVSITISTVIYSWTSSNIISYQWINCDNNQILSGETSWMLNPQSNGDYAVIVENNFGCIDTSNCLNFISNLHTESLEKDNLTIFPNPVIDYLNIDGIDTSQILFYEIVDLTGKIHCKSEILISNNKIDVSFLNYGIYLIRIFTTDKIFNAKFILDN